MTSEDRSPHPSPTSPTLYFAPGSCSLAPHICLFEAGATFKGVPVLLAKGEQKSPQYLALNPRGRVPVLVTDKQVITENIAILTYTAARYREAGLLPFDRPDLLARAYELMSWYASSLHVAIAQTWRTERFTADEALWPPLRLHSQRQLADAFFEIDAICREGGPWILGERFSVLDPYTLIFLRWGERLGIDMTQHRAWAEHRGRMMDRPSVKNALEAEQQATAAAAAVN